MLKIVYHKKAVKHILCLGQNIARRIAEKIEWIAEQHAVISHDQLANLPEDLRGLCKYRVGNYRILYCLKEKELQIYDVIHRSNDYKIIRKG